MKCFYLSVASNNFDRLVVFPLRQIEVYVNDFIISVCLAFVLHLLFEAPALRINELLNTVEEDDDDRHDLPPPPPPPPSHPSNHTLQHEQFKPPNAPSLPHQLYLENTNKHLTYVFENRESHLSSRQQTNDESHMIGSGDPSQVLALKHLQMPKPNEIETPTSITYDETTNTNIINIRF